VGADRVALVSLGAGEHRELLDITRASREAYARRHGMMVVEEYDDRAEGRPPSWGRVPLLLELISSQRFDTLVWIDADAIVVDADDDVSVDRPSGAHLAMVHHRFHDQTVPNAGVCVVRTSRWSAALLRRVWARDQFVDHPWWENAALLDILGLTTVEPVRKVARSRFEARVAELPARWNAIPQAPVPHRPAIVHLPGFDHETRVRCLSALASDPSAAAQVLHAPSHLAIGQRNQSA
jgi:hypothetical protein